MPSSRPFRFDAEKGLELLLYVANRSTNRDLYWVLKVPYFADKYHLERVARTICGDTYYAMKDGPVPGGLYDIVKDVRDRRRLSTQTSKAQSSFEVKGNTIIPRRDADLEFFSKTDTECLSRAISEIQNLSFGELKDKSHDAAYEGADPNGEIPIEAIAAMLSNGEAITKAIHD
jgi:uncharacterized phage-associated protein